jgi:hypothetical protein
MRVVLLLRQVFYTASDWLVVLPKN